MFEAFINKYPKGLTITEINEKTGMHKETIVKYMNILTRRKKAHKFYIGLGDKRVIMYSAYNHKLGKMGGPR